jgi:rRNA maturation endonuclease Nob1
MAVNNYNTSESMNKKRIYIAACGICCSVCGLYLKGICLPCGSGLKKEEKRRANEELGARLFKTSMYT